MGPFYADFACVSHKLVVELDGDYHDHVQENDLRRQRYLEREGWNVIRFTNEDVLRDAEAVLRSIAARAGIPFSFQKRTSKRSGMMSENNQFESRPTPHPAATASDLPKGGVKNV